jgi:hypothetical protein
MSCYVKNQKAVEYVKVINHDGSKAYKVPKSVFENPNGRRPDFEGQTWEQWLVMHGMEIPI